MASKAGKSGETTWHLPGTRQIINGAKRRSDNPKSGAGNLRFLRKFSSVLARALKEVCQPSSRRKKFKKSRFLKGRRIINLPGAPTYLGSALAVSKLINNIF